MILKRRKRSDWPRMIRSSDCPVPMVDFAAESSAIMIAHAHAHACACAHALCSMDGFSSIGQTNSMTGGRGIRHCKMSAE